MLLLRYQRQRAEDGCDGGGLGRNSDHEMRRKINDRDLKGDSHRAATRGTLICIFVCGSALLSLGVVILCVGLLLEVPRRDPTPWLVIGPTCIVLGVLVLLLSVEIILKLRKIGSSSSSSRSASAEREATPMAPPPPTLEVGLKAAPPPPVVVHPATPLQPLDPSSLPLEVVQHR